MMNRYLRGAILTLTFTALCGPLGLPSSTTALAASGISAAAMALPVKQIDPFGYGGTSATSASDIGSLVAKPHVNTSTPKQVAYNNRTDASANGASRDVALDLPDPLSYTPSIRALGLMSTRDLESKSLKSLYQLARLTTPTQPHLDVTLFGGGLASQDYYLTDEGIQLEQSITEGLGLVVRATGYQLWIEKNSTSPLAPSNQTANRLNFGRFQAGFDLSPMPGFNFVFLGGHDVGDSDAWTVESDISMWFMLNSPHPFNVFIAPVHNFQNDVTSSEIDFRVVAMQTPDWILLLGAGGQVFGGGFISGIDGEGGPIVGIYNRIYQMGADLQFGYGSPGFYGELNLYKTFSIPGL